MNIKFPLPISPLAEDLIRKMLILKPEDRISFPEIFCHPWLRNIIGPDGLPVEGDDPDDDTHDFNMNLSFQRQECNLNPMSVAGFDRGSRNKGVEGEITQRCANAINQLDGPQQNQKVL